MLKYTATKGLWCSKNYEMPSLVLIKAEPTNSRFAAACLLFCAKTVYTNT